MTIIEAKKQVSCSLLSRPTKAQHMCVSVSVCTINCIRCKVKGEVVPLTGPVWPRGWVEV